LNPELGGWRSRFIALDPVSNALNTNHDIMTGTGKPWRFEPLIERSRLAITPVLVFSQRSPRTSRVERKPKY
jgi:hypothetical protein